MANFSPEEIDQMRKNFAWLSKDKNGAIDLYEMRGLVRQLGYQHTTEIENMFATYLPAGKMHTFSNFLELMEILHDDPDEDLKRLFEEIDRDGDKYISHNEVKRYWRSVGEFLTDKEVADLIRAADKDGDGRISFNEFKEMLDARE